MSVSLLVARLVLASVFLLAAAGKLTDLQGSRQAVAAFGVPERFASLVGLLLPLAELAVAAALLPVGTAAFGAAGATVLLAGFVGAIGYAMAQGRAPDCHCFGQLHSAPAGWRTLARNTVLLALSVFVAVAGWRNGGTSAVGWLAGASLPWLVAGAVGAGAAALAGFFAWFSLQLLAQNGRVLGRLEAIEQAVAELAADSPAVREPVALGTGLNGIGLPVGEEAPGFALASADGEEVSLDWLLSQGRRLMLVFVDSGCGPCHALLPDLAGWQRRYRDELTLVLVASGDDASNRARASRHGLAPMLLQREREVSEAYGAYGTPSALVVSRQGLIESPVVGGAEAITTLVAQAVAQPAPRPPTDAQRESPRPADDSRVGLPAPALVLRDLADRQVALADLYAERTLVLFWNPGCGFCQRMLLALKRFEENPPEQAPRLVLVSTGDPDSVREHGLRSLVLVDPDAAALEAFGAGGTPMGVLVEQGRIASPLAAGADAILQLADLPPASETGDEMSDELLDATRSRRGGP